MIDKKHKNFLKLAVLAVCALTLLAFAAAACSENSLERASSTRLAMGTTVTIIFLYEQGVDHEKIMDEAFSALDPLIRGDMQNELMSLQARMKKTILFITHDLDEALKIGNQVVLMKDGQVVQIGTPEEIITTPADDYVKQFVENVDKSKVLTAQAILTKTQAVAYPDDNPRTIADKMQHENCDSLLVVKPDNSLQGIVHAKSVHQAVERGDQTIIPIIESELPTVTTTTFLTRLIAILANWSGPVPVVDQENKLQGIVNHCDVFAALAKGGN